MLARRNGLREHNGRQRARAGNFCLSPSAHQEVNKMKWELVLIPIEGSPRLHLFLRGHYAIKILEEIQQLYLKVVLNGCMQVEVSFTVKDRELNW
mgnify:CR=1 FL=1